MTTVVYRDGILASDSACYAGTTKVHSMKKVWRISGHLVGLAGDVDAINAFKKWFAAGADVEKYPIEKKQQLAVIVVTPEGKVFTYEDRDPIPLEIIDGEYVAVGSGADVALGAMHAGASAPEAIKAAIAHSAKTDGKIQMITLRPEE
jgi:ATP-dependent protease HslVU (ClpYQ) peptidase subunit